MRKIIICLTILYAAGAYAENSEITTSQYYVDTKLSEKQDAAPANNANSVMTYDSTSADGTGSKAIYDTAASYSTQKDTLVTAVTANAAIQNAVNMEFTCANPPKCTLWNMAGIFQQDNPTPHAAGKNLFNTAKAKERYKSSPFIKSTKNPNGYTITYDTGTASCAFILFEWGDINDFLGKTLTLSTKSTCTDGGSAIFYIGISNDDGTVRQVLADIPEHPDANMTKVAVWLYSHCGSSAVTTNPTCTYYDIQVEEGDTATAYEPYQNLYIPENQQ